jgi:hypothetical protein
LDPWGYLFLFLFYLFIFSFLLFLDWLPVAYQILGVNFILHQYGSL